jgi:hypothetical protein
MLDLLNLKMNMIRCVITKINLCYSELQGKLSSDCAIKYHAKMQQNLNEQELRQ